ncbi:serine/threonine-protein kinase [Actinoplanes utahensis]|uniref:serine/threonine-protein kinase n=1 Tax=Actinoplanes utahensis TaxID=1869 RepID=UPI0009FE1862|nr:serine/threonine-protein kinase [Actinoplanes utahensis]GIF30558.1 hypothetical protein Aut01nite_35440 [Actinoplanes utahensis]
MLLGNRYLLRQRLGAGGMGEVWLATDEVLQRTVAVKLMLPGVADDPDFARRFEAEATSMARVNHPAVASIHDFGRDQGRLYLVLEYVEGESLSQRLSRGRLSPEETMRMVAQTAAGLQAVHDRGLVHRDIKPANLLVRPDGTVVITDFGIARHEDAGRLTVSGAILGTPTYLSPEQVRGEPAGPLSDVYSLGLVAYECLAGEKPFVGENPYAVALQRLQSGPRTMTVDIPLRVRAVVERALAVEPQDRWQSAAELAAAAGVPAPVVERPRRPALHPLLAGFAAMLLVVGGLVVWGSRPSGEEAAAVQPEATQSQQREPVGFTACGGTFCPVEPMCWGGLVATSGVAAPPRRVDCAEGHYWETFAAMPLPAGGVMVGGKPLIDSPHIGVACAEEVMAARSFQPDDTRGWRRDAWPIPVGEDTLLHCIAGAPGGESTGRFFKSG